MADDIDWPNQGVFTYTAHPRSVESLGHLPPDFQVPNATTQYVALWDQTTYRSSVARADSSVAFQQLSSSPGLGMICSYSDRFGNNGWMFGANGAVAAAPHTVSGPPSLSAAGLALTILGLGVLWAIGALILGALGVRKLWPGLWASAALPMGCVAVTLEMLVFSISGLRWSLTALLVPWIALAALIAWRRPALVHQLLTLRFKRPAFDRYELVAIAGLVGSVALVAVASPLAMPGADGFAYCYFKANAFFIDGSVLPYYQHASEFLYSMPAHPPLMPLSVTWLYLFLGQVQERSTLLLWPSLYVSLLGTLYVLVRTQASRKQALWYVLLASFVAHDLMVAAIGSGFADMPLALFLLLGAGCWWLRASSSRGAWLLPAVSGIFLGAAVLTKEEGSLGTVAVLAASPLLTWGRGKLRWDMWWSGLEAGGIAAGVASIWIGLRLTYHLPILIVDLGAKVESVSHRLLPSITGIGLRAAPYLALAAIVVAAVIVVRKSDLSIWQIFDRRFQFLAAIVLVLLAGYVLASAMSPLDIRRQVSTSATRLVSQVLPLILLGLVQPLRALLAATPARENKAEEIAEHSPL